MLKMHKHRCGKEFSNTAFYLFFQRYFLYPSMDTWSPAKGRRLSKRGIKKNGKTTDIHIKNLPMLAWRIARGAATIEGLPVATWVAQAIFEKWARRGEGTGTTISPLLSARNRNST